MKKLAKKMTMFFMGIGSMYLLLLLQPNVLFAHHYEYKNYQVYSDRPIDENIKFVLDDALKRIQRSELYHLDAQFRVYLCNENWRFKLLTRNGNAGGLVNFVISGNIYIRENIIPENRIIPPDSWVNPLTDRPLSYFIAHESIHSLQRSYDQFLVLKLPTEIVEGYAEFIAKPLMKNVDDLIENYRNKTPNMDPATGLYDKYYLYMHYLMEEKGFDFQQIVRERPNLDETLQEVSKQ